MNYPYIERQHGEFLAKLILKPPKFTKLPRSTEASAKVVPFVVTFPLIKNASDLAMSLGCSSGL